MNRFAFSVNMFAALSGALMLSFVQSACADQVEMRGALQEPLNGSKHPQVPPGELKTADAVDAPMSAPAPTPATPRERLSPEERRQLRRDINDAGRDIYRQNQAERPRRF
jgi:uncharacterized membrane protein